MESLHKTATSIGGAEPGDRDRKERSYDRDMRRLDRDERQADRADRQSNRDTRPGGGRSGNGITVEHMEVKLRDERDLMRWASDLQRQIGVAAVRG